LHSSPTTASSIQPSKSHSRTIFAPRWRRWRDGPSSIKDPSDSADMADETARGRRLRGLRGSPSFIAVCTVPEVGEIQSAPGPWLRSVTTAIAREWLASKPSTRSSALDLISLQREALMRHGLRAAELPGGEISRQSIRNGRGRGNPPARRQGRSSAST
jgi:hypothetical protein